MRSPGCMMSHLSLRDRPQGVNQLQLVLLVGQLVDVRAGLLETPPGQSAGGGHSTPTQTRRRQNSTPLERCGCLWAETARMTCRSGSA